MRTSRTLLEQKLTRILAYVSARPEETVTAETKLEDLGLESLDRVTLAIEVEAEFGISISDADVIDLQTVGDVFALIERLEKDLVANA